MVPSPEETSPRTGAQDVVADAAARARARAAADPPQHPDVLFRGRSDDDKPVSVWWMIGAFLAVSGAAVALSGLIPAGR